MPKSLTMPVLLLTSVTLVLMSGFGVMSNPVFAQVRISPTPLSASLPQAQPPQAAPLENVAPTLTPSLTPTEDLVVSLEVKPDLGNADTRELPDFEDGARIDSIETGTRYPVTGRYYEWLQFRYDKSTTGFGWVHQSLVTLNREGLIPDIDPFATPSATPPGGNIEETRAAATLTPGAIDTLDAQARLIGVPTLLSTDEAEASGPLPTFTLPAEVAPRDAPVAVEESLANTFEETLVRAAAGQIPPIVPILLLAGAGLLGLIGSLWRR